MFLFLCGIAESDLQNSVKKLKRRNAAQKNRNLPKGILYCPNLSAAKIAAATSAGVTLKGML
jgi:hypothetical protein